MILRGLTMIHIFISLSQLGYATLNCVLLVCWWLVGPLVHSKKIGLVNYSWKMLECRCLRAHNVDRSTKCVLKHCFYGELSIMILILGWHNILWYHLVMRVIVKQKGNQSPLSKGIRINNNLHLHFFMFLMKYMIKITIRCIYII